MTCNFLVLTEQGRKKPHGVVMHVVGEQPRWQTTSRQMENVFRILFSRETVHANRPDGMGGFERIRVTYDDSDYLAYAAVKVNIPLLVEARGTWDFGEISQQEALAYLVRRFLEDES